MITGGAVKEISISNPDAGTKFFYGMKDEDSTIELGGYTKENTIDGGGRLISNMQPKMGTIEATCSNDPSDTLPEFEFLQLCSNSTNECTITFALTGGMIYAGSGTIEGNPQLSGSKMTVQFKVVSGAGFTNQS